VDGRDKPGHDAGELRLAEIFRKSLFSPELSAPISLLSDCLSGDPASYSNPGGTRDLHHGLTGKFCNQWEHDPFRKTGLHFSGIMLETITQ
jgi:hypothetical protein